MRMPIDKIYHFIVGIMLYVALYGIYYFGQVPVVIMGMPTELIVLFNVGIIAVAKEVYDKDVKLSKFDYFDMFATIVGGVVGLFATMIFMKIVGV